eukprot:3343591-Amphidinium_carterae.1
MRPPTRGTSSAPSSPAKVGPHAHYCGRRCDRLPSLRMQFPRALLVEVNAYHIGLDICLIKAVSLLVASDGSSFSSASVASCSGRWCTLHRVEWLQ